MKERDGRSDKNLRCARVIRDTLTMLERAFVQRKMEYLIFFKAWMIVEVFSSFCFYWLFLSIIGFFYGDDILVPLFRRNDVKFYLFSLEISYF